MSNMNIPSYLTPQLTTEVDFTASARLQIHFCRVYALIDESWKNEGVALHISRLTAGSKAGFSPANCETNVVSSAEGGLTWIPE